MYKFLQNNEWKYLINVFRYHFRDDNKNIKTWKVEKDDRWEDTVVMLTAMAIAMEGLEKAVTENNMAGIRLFESSIRTQVQDVMENFVGHMTSTVQLCRGGYDHVKMEFSRAASCVECHRLFGDVKFLRLCVLLRGAGRDFLKYQAGLTKTYMCVYAQTHIHVILPYIYV